MQFHAKSAIFARVETEPNRLMEIFKTHNDQIVYTVIILVSMIGAHLATNRIVSNTLKRHRFSFARRKVIVKILNLVIFITGNVFLAAIWGIERSEFTVFFTAVSTVLGIAFFASWSILSNITSSLILFFNHPLKLGDTIRIIEKDYDVEGKVEDISFFFIHLKTPTKEKITVPNSVALQKTIIIKPKTS